MVFCYYVMATIYVLCFAIACYRRQMQRRMVIVAVVALVLGAYVIKRAVANGSGPDLTGRLCDGSDTYTDFQVDLVTQLKKKHADINHQNIALRAHNLYDNHFCEPATRQVGIKPLALSVGVEGSGSEAEQLAFDLGNTLAGFLAEPGCHTQLDETTANIKATAAEANSRCAFPVFTVPFLRLDTKQQEAFHGLCDETFAHHKDAIYIFTVAKDNPNVTFNDHVQTSVTNSAAVADPGNDNIESALTLPLLSRVLPRGQLDIVVSV